MICIIQDTEVVWAPDADDDVVEATAAVVEVAVVADWAVEGSQERGHVQQDG